VVRRAIAALLAAIVAAATLAVGTASDGPTAHDAAPARPAPPSPVARTLPSDADLTRDAAGRARLFDAIEARLREVYFDPARIDWLAWRARYRESVVEAASRPSLDAAFRRAFQGLEDGHSRWIGRPAEGVPSAAPDGTGPPTELGAEVLPLDERGLLILRVHPGGAAERAGLQRGDVLVRVGERSLDEPGLGWAMQNRVAQGLRAGGAELGVDRAGEGRIELALLPTALPPGARERVRLDLDAGLGVARVDLPSFASGSAQEVHAAVREAREAGARGLVLDLRGNPGGSVVEMGLVAALLVDGVVAESWRVDGPDWSLDVARDAAGASARLVRVAGPLAGSDVAAGRLVDAERWDGPWAVLVDERSASAAEVLAAVWGREAGVPVIGVPPAGNVESVRRVSFPGGNEAWVAVGDLRAPGGASLVPLSVAVEAVLEPAALARGLDAPLAEAARLLRGLPVTPGRWF
jgi:carboxyl-terminal processing protease